MTADTRFEKVTVTFALGLPCITSIGLMMWVPGTVSRSTYVLAAALLVAIAAVTIRTWKSAQATGSVGQLIYETNSEGAANSASATRWERWVRRYDRSASMGRGVAVLLLGAAATAIIVTAWLS